MTEFPHVTSRRYDEIRQDTEGSRAWCAVELLPWMGKLPANRLDSLCGMRHQEINLVGETIHRRITTQAIEGAKATLSQGGVDLKSEEKKIHDSVEVIEALIKAVYALGREDERIHQDILKSN